MEELKHKILNVGDGAIDVAPFDSLMGILSTGTPHQVILAQEILTEFKASENAFYNCIVLLTTSQVISTRFFALQVVDEQINTYWNALDESTRTNIRNTIITEISKECTSFEQIRNSRVLLTKLNTTLVSIAKREWPMRWPDFIKDVCMSAKPDHPMVENNLNLLRIVGEEVFEFGSKTLTTRWRERKKKALATDFTSIMVLCCQVLQSTVDTKLLKVVLLTLNEYIPWVDLQLVFDEPLLNHIAGLVIGDETVRTPALRCLAEVVSLPQATGGVGDTQSQIALRVFETALTNICSILPTSNMSAMEQIVNFYEASPSNHEYVSALNLFLTSFMKNYYARVYYNNHLILGIHSLLVGMSNIFDKELFKACVEYWWWLGNFFVVSSISSAKRSLQSILPRTLSDVRYVLTKRMAKPEEIIIIVEDGQVRRETLQDVEEVELYELMRQALVFLTLLDPRDTIDIMINLMQRQLDRSEWSWSNCHTLAWAVGAVARALSEEEENKLFITIMQGLLQLCKDMRGTENRAVVLSSIMFVVGKYPRYLRTHRNFLVTVLRKLFDFMLESEIAGVQDMAVDTLLTLARELPREFVDTSDGGKGIISEMADRWSIIISRLNVCQTQSCYRAVGCMLASAMESQGDLIMRFIGETLTQFKLLTECAVQMGVNFCLAPEATTLLQHMGVLSSIADTCGDAFMQPMDIIVQDLYGFYRLFTQAITEWFAGNMQGQPTCQAAQTVRALRREILSIFTRFVSHTQYHDFVAACCMPDIFAVVLQDFENSVPEAREPGALALVAQCVHTLGKRLEDKCATILDHTFPMTVAMLADSMESFPDFRVNLFKLLHALNMHCFDAFVAYSATNEDIVMAMLWAFKHKDYPTMKTGLDMLDTFLTKVVDSPFAEAFFTAYMQRIFLDVLVAAMDTLHAAGFPQHASILFKLFRLSSLVPYNTPSIGRQAVESFLMENMLIVPTLDRAAITSFLAKCYETCEEQQRFTEYMADFLIEAKVWGAEEENRMHEEEERRAREEIIPGFADLSLKPDPNPFAVFN